jgi:hypothetical protein
VIDPELPIPLILGQLKELPAWKLLEERLIAVRDGRLRHLITMPADTPAQEIQRVLGFMEGLNRVLAEPDQIQKEWERARAKSPAHTPTAPRATE